MTGTVIIGGLILLVVAVFAWARVSTARAEGRSIKTYGHALGVLGEVARRGDSSGNVRIIPHDSAGRAHVRAGGPGTESEFPAPAAPRAALSLTVEATAAGAVASARAVAGAVASALAAPAPGAVATAPSAPDATAPAVASGAAAGVPARSGPGAPRIGTSSNGMEAPLVRRSLPGGSTLPPERGVVSLASGTPRISLPVPARPLRFEDDTLPPVHAAPAARVRAARPGELRRQVTARRVATGAAACVAALVAVGGALQLTGGAGHSARPPGGQSPARGHHARGGTAPAAGGAGSGGAATSPSGAAQRLVPTSTTTSDVSFQVPSRKYLLTFSDTGTSDCWVGIETAAGSGVWLWVETLQPGSTTSYGASGPVVVDLGAPKNIEIRVNGIAAELPGYAGSYYLSFTATPSA